MGKAEDLGPDAVGEAIAATGGLRDAPDVIVGDIMIRDTDRNPDPAASAGVTTTMMLRLAGLYPDALQICESTGRPERRSQVELEKSKGHQ